MIQINKYSRHGSKLKEVMAIVIHWPDAKNKSAQWVHDYFNTGVPKEKRYGSAHYVVGLDGEIVQCIPEDEIAYHCGSSRIDPISEKIYTNLARDIFGNYADKAYLSPNMVSLGIEVCHIDDKGTMNKCTVDALVKFVAELCVKYGLDPARQVLRHYDVVGYKRCPKYWVDNSQSWRQFLTEVEAWKS